MIEKLNPPRHREVLPVEASRGTHVFEDALICQVVDRKDRTGADAETGCTRRSRVKRRQAGLPIVPCRMSNAGCRVAQSTRRGRQERVSTRVIWKVAARVVVNAVAVVQIRGSQQSSGMCPVRQRCVEPSNVARKR